MTVPFGAKELEADAEEDPAKAAGVVQASLKAVPLPCHRAQRGELRRVWRGLEVGAVSVCRRVAQGAASVCLGPNRSLPLLSTRGACRLV